MLSELIKEIIMAEYASGMTQQELAKKYNVGYQAIGHLVSGRRPFSGLSLATVEKMFPHAEFTLYGTNNAAINGNNNTVNQQKNFIAGDTVAKLETAIMSDDEIPAELKVKLYKMIREAQK